MLWELLSLLTDRGTHLARRFGHDREAVAIAARYRRCREAWRPHLEAVKTLILEAAAQAPGQDTALILGSGLCLDVPVAQLCARFRKVLLVDVHHPRRARGLIKKYRGLRLVTADITAMAETVERARAGKAPLPQPIPRPDPLPGLRPDFTVSLNLASQLPIPFANLLSGHMETQALQQFCREIIEAHFAWLATLSGRVSLVCDRSWDRVDGKEILERRDALEGVALPEPDRAWIWNIAPRPEESRAYDRQNQVWGYMDFLAARRR